MAQRNKISEARHRVCLIFRSTSGMFGIKQCRTLHNQHCVGFWSGTVPHHLLMSKVYSQPPPPTTHTLLSSSRDVTEEGVMLGRLPWLCDILRKTAGVVSSITQRGKKEAFSLLRLSLSIWANGKHAQGLLDIPPHLLPPHSHSTNPPHTHTHTHPRHPTIPSPCSGSPWWQFD